MEAKMEDRRLQENPNRKQKRTETKNKGKVVVVDGVLPFRDKTLLECHVP
jgi:uridine kinase